MRDYRLFLGEFWRTYHTTGAVLPSSAGLARALTQYVGEPATSSAASNGSAQGGSAQGRHPPRRILEVGPGTGSVTRFIIRELPAEDRLDLAELNDRFVARLRERFEKDEPFRQVAGRAEILHQPVEEIADRGPYDLIISGLPLNNFSADSVERILSVLMQLLKPGGTLSFFEYIAIRRIRAVVGGRDQRARLRGIGRLMHDLLERHEIRRDSVWLNVPPAWVHHVQRPADTSTSAG
ncbi:MAG: methyltransferase domain-containing protein [Pirellulales bacterium]